MELPASPRSHEMPDPCLPPLVEAPDSEPDVTREGPWIIEWWWDGADLLRWPTPCPAPIQ